MLSLSFPDYFLVQYCGFYNSAGSVGAAFLTILITGGGEKWEGCQKEGTKRNQI